MKVGLFVFTTADSVDPGVLARRAEELEFESFWVPEHPIIPVDFATPTVDGGPLPSIYNKILDPFVALARASATTSTIGLGTAICLVPERDPLVLAKEVATLDHLSGGRFIFGIGAGWIREETEIMGADFPHRWTQTREAVMAMKELWTKEESEYHGKYYDFPPVRSFPKPAQVPHPPILLGGDGWARGRKAGENPELARGRAPAVFRRIVEWGDGWMPGGASLDDIRVGRAILDRLAAEAGRDPASLGIMAFCPGTLFGKNEYKNREGIRDLAAAGADRVSLWLNNDTDEKAALAEMEEIARNVL